MTICGQKYLVFTGIFLLNFPNGFTWYFGNLSSYTTSTLRFYLGPEVDIETVWVVSIFMAMWTGGLMLGGLAQRASPRPRLLALIGVLLFDGALAATSWTIQHSLWLYIFSLGALAGLADGITCSACMSLIAMWETENVGFATAATTSGLGFGAIFTNQIISRYVNPNNLVADDQDGNLNLFSQEEIVTKVPRLFLLLASCNLVFHSIGLILLRVKPEPHNLLESSNLATEESILGSPEAETSSKIWIHQQQREEHPQEQKILKYQPGCNQSLSSNMPLSDNSITCPHMSKNPSNTFFSTELEKNIRAGESENYEGDLLSLLMESTGLKIFGNQDDIEGKKRNHGVSNPEYNRLLENNLSTKSNIGVKRLETEHENGSVTGAQYSHPKKYVESHASTIPGGECKPLLPDKAEDQPGKVCTTKSYTPKEMLGTRMFFVLWLAQFCMDYTLAVLTNYYKLFGELYIYDDHFLALLGTLMTASIVLPKLIWGTMLDRYGVKVTLATMSAIAAVIASLWCHTARIDRWLYSALTMGLCWCVCAFDSLAAAAVLLAFGPAHYNVNYGLVGSASILLNLVSPIIMQFLLDRFGWTWLFLSAALLNAIVLLQTLLCIDLQKANRTP